MQSRIADGRQSNEHQPHALSPAPVRIQRKRTKGWKMPENTVSVTRPGRYGNPFTVKQAREAGYKGSDREMAQMCVDIFRHEMPDFAKVAFIQELRGKNLACWCPLNQPCHADVLLELANSPAVAETDAAAPGNVGLLGGASAESKSPTNGGE